MICLIIWVKILVKMIYLKTAFDKVSEKRKPVNLVFEKQALVSEIASTEPVRTVFAESLSVRTPFGQKVLAGNQALGNLSD